ncbi:MFS transporter [Paenibacillus chitinolyticus]|uniref:MFS transporter n=1 Tax=Paenibacillus chitinolyticus TaxID=79263 RepID=UPI002DBA9A7F|nr:MFS transporter [Paenibacillus chitinolyticus]MEC0245855.1 MFS transporter [Paenibacillus chitinolyticus]
MQTNPSIQKNNGELLLGILVFTLIISVMNATMFNVVLPTISKQFQLSPSQVSWIITSYMIVYAIGSVTYGKLTDRYSLKNLLTFGLLLFAIGSVVGLVAIQYWMVIVGRIVQAAGASVIPAIAMIVPVRYFSPERRGRALGTVAIGYAIGLAIGPIIAGVVSSTWNWRVLFVISLLSLLTLPIYRKYLDDEKRVVSKMDFIGGSLLAGTVAILLLALTNENIWLVLAGTISFVFFLLRIRYASAPFINPAIFRNKPFSYGLIITFVMVGISFAIPFITPQLLSSVHHLSPVFIGMVMLPSALMAAFLGRRGGKLADEKGNPILVYTAAALLIIGFICLSSVVGMSPVFIAIFLIFGVLGQSFMQIAMSNTVSRTLSKEHIGVGMGLFSMITFISSAASTAAIGKVLDSGTSTVRLNPIPQNSTTFVYSNIFLALAVLVAVMAALYYVQFGRVANMAKDEKMDSESVA